MNIRMPISLYLIGVNLSHFKLKLFDLTELKTLEWWISGLMLNPNIFLISRLNMACFSNKFNLQISQQIGIKDIPF